ncbi:MAG: YibE/F family protein [Oscillospiraceae bacterium]|jgi:uncharacterized membrane protein|nr:YibE/F family protein [Oscillospiraceae bacterium]
MKNRRRNWIFCIVMGAVTVAMGFLPSRGGMPGTGGIPRVSVRIDAVDNTQLAPLGIVYSGVQLCEVTVTSGEHKGETAQAINNLDSAIEKDKLYEPGDKAVAMLHMKDGEIRSLTLIDHYRLPIQGLLFGLFGLLLIAFGGVSGAGALVSLAASVMIVWKLLIPMLYAGISPTLCALGIVVLLTLMIDLLVAGFTRTAWIAIAGSLLGTLTTCALSAVFGRMLKLDGSNLPYVVPILAQSALKFNLRELFFAMAFIANSGALMDLSMDVSSACQEVRTHAPDIRRSELLKSGFAVGRNVIGTMTTTLMLAYSGSYLSLLLYFFGQGTPVIDILNLKYVASEVLITLVGSFGLVTVAPFTAIVASLVFTKKATMA